MELEERTLGFERARESAVDRGIHVSARVPAGYSRDDARLLVPNEDAPAILAAFEARADGATWEKVAATLTDAGVAKSRETDSPVWTAQAVAQLVENRVYLGEARAGKTTAGAYIVKADAHEAIVSEGLFARVAARKTERDSFAAPDRRRDLLAGLVTCAGCGGAMVKDARVKDGVVVQRYLRCSTRCSERAAISTTVLDGYVFDYLAEHAAALDIEAPRSGDEGRRAAEIQLANAQAEVAAFLANVPATTPGYGDAVAQRQARVDEAAKALNETHDETGDDLFADALRLDVDTTGLDAKTAARFESLNAAVLKARDTGVAEGDAIGALILTQDTFDNAKARRMVRQLVAGIVVSKGRAPVAERVTVTLV
jgi:hypothetical protein